VLKFFIAYNTLVRCLGIRNCRLNIIQTYGPLCASCSAQIAHLVSNAGCQIPLEALSDFEVARRTDKRKKNILYNVFGGTDIIQKPGPYSHQIISVLFIDTAESILAADIQFPDKQLIFQRCGAFSKGTTIIVKYKTQQTAFFP
jgi:hypothetical protein